MSLATVLVIILVLVLIGALPAWPHSRAWGNSPAGAIALVLIVVVLLWALGVIH